MSNQQSDYDYKEISVRSTININRSPFSIDKLKKAYNGVVLKKLGNLSRKVT